MGPCVGAQVVGGTLRRITLPAPKIFGEDGVVRPGRGSGGTKGSLVSKVFPGVRQRVLYPPQSLSSWGLDRRRHHLSNGFTSPLP